MAADGKDDKRFVSGPRPVGALVPALTRPAFRKRSPATAQLQADWGAIVGPALAAITAPRRLSAATLTLACSGPLALELQHMAPELLARINGHFGRVLAERLRFVQEPPPAVTPAAQELGPAPPVAGLEAGPLNNALARLGQAVKRRGQR